MGFLDRLKDCMDEAHEQEPQSVQRAREIKQIHNQQMMELINQSLAYHIQKFGMEPDFIAVNEKYEIPVGVPRIGK